jgi:hypothetical protein
MKSILLAVPGARSGIPLALAGVVLLSGCASTPTVEGLYANPDFDANATRSAEIGVLGVVSTAQPIYREQRLEYGTIIASAIQQKGGYRVENPGYVASKIGEETLQQMLDQYKETGHLGLVALEHINDVAPDIGYVVVARIDRDDVQKDKSHYEWENDSKPDVKVTTDAAGNLTVDDVTYTSDKVQVTDNYTTVRTMSVTFEVFDLPAGTTAWSGHVRQTDRRNSNQQHTYDADNRFAQQLGEAVAQGVVAGVTGTKTDPYPAPIDERDLFTTITAEFAKNLP